MKLEITKKIENPLMRRTRVLFEVEHTKEGTPSRKQIKDVLGAKLGANKDLIIIYNLKSAFGKNLTYGIAFLYKDKKAFDLLVSKYLLKRDSKAPKAKEAPAEKPEDEKTLKEESKREGKTKDTPEQALAEEKKEGE